MTFSDDEFHHLPKVISTPRFATYLQAAGGDGKRALRLYWWNLEVCAAFMMPLHICEVSTRNAVVEALENVHGAQWPWAHGFVRSLPDPRGGYSSKKDLLNNSNKYQSSGKIVAELKFVFWESIFTVRHENRLWKNHILSVFPGATVGIAPSNLRENLHSSLSVVRQLRNRIAHHEPIFKRNLCHDYNVVLDVIRWRNPVVAKCVDQHQHVQALILRRP